MSNWISTFRNWLLGTKAKRLYKCLKSYAKQNDTMLCMLHFAVPKTPCPESIKFCGTIQKVHVINFDSIKEKYGSNNKKASLSSVDAVAYKKDVFLFIEIKSWQNFEAYQIKKTDTQADIDRKIIQKAQRFNLRKKIDESIEICEQVSKDEHLFDKIPYIYVLVTDVNTIVDPMVRFRARLRVLAYNSVYIPKYAKASQDELNALGIKTRYVFCRKFDEFYKSL